MEPNKIAAIKIPQVKVSSRQAIAEILIRYICILKEIKLSKTELYVLGFFLCEGYSQISKEKLLDTKVMKDRFALSNILSRFRKQGILKNEGFKEFIAVDFNYTITDKLIFSVMLDNT